MNKLYKFYWDYGRMGHVDGLIISTDEKIKSNLGEPVYFGDVLGEHSEIEGIIEESDFTEISDNQELIKNLKDIFKSDTLSGYNPFEYIQKN